MSFIEDETTKLRARIEDMSDNLLLGLGYDRIIQRLADDGVDALWQLRLEGYPDDTVSMLARTAFRLLLVEFELAQLRQQAAECDQEGEAE